MNVWGWIVLLLTMNFWAAPNHALYLSVIEMTISGSQLQEMKVKVFSDDLVDVVRAELGEMIPLSKEYSNDDLKFIETYFFSHLWLVNESDTMKFGIQNAVIEGDATWIDFVMEEEILGDFELIADYFMEIFPTQANMLRLNIDGQKSFHQVRKSDKELAITIPN